MEGTELVLFPVAVYGIFLVLQMVSQMDFPTVRGVAWMVLDDRSTIGLGSPRALQRVPMWGVWHW